jgi:hypothetical protein
VIALGINVMVAVVIVVVGVLTPADYRRNGRKGAHVSWSRTEDRAARTAPARAAMLRKFECQVDPEGVLTPEERTRRAEHARLAWYADLGRKAAAARQAKRQAS